VILCLEAAGRPALRRKGLALRSWASRGSRPVRGHRGLRLSVGKKTLVRTGPPVDIAPPRNTVGGPASQSVANRTAACSAADVNTQLSIRKSTPSPEDTPCFFGASCRRVVHPNACETDRGRVRAHEANNLPLQLFAPNPRLVHNLVSTPTMAALPKRIIKETERLSKEPVPGISAVPHDDNLRYFDVTIDGPSSSPYEGMYVSLFCA
jgi:hypothetical protein